MTMMKVGQKFKSKSKIQDEPIEYKIVRKDPFINAVTLKCPDKTLMIVEYNWFNQRKIKEV